MNTSNKHHALHLLILSAWLTAWSGTATFASPADAAYCRIDDAPALDRPNDANALEGVSVGRILWDVTIADPSFLASRLDVIAETYRDLVRQGVTPEFILAFRGGAVRLLAKDPSGLPEESRLKAGDVTRRLEALSAQPGIRLESCYIAMRRVPLEPEHLNDVVHTVGNTFLSAMGYGQKGYITIPIH